MLEWHHALPADLTSTTTLALGKVPGQAITTYVCVVSKTACLKVLSFICSHVLIDGVLQSLALLENAILHFLAQLMVHLEILHLILHVSLFLGVD